MFDKPKIRQPPLWGHQAVRVQAQVSEFSYQCLDIGYRISDLHSLLGIGDWGAQKPRKLHQPEPYSLIFDHHAGFMLAHLGPMLVHLWPMLVHLGAMLAQLGAMLAHLGPMLAYLGPMLAYLDANLAQLGANMAQHRSNMASMSRSRRQNAFRKLRLL